jgi:hypothetical protein
MAVLCKEIFPSPFLVTHHIQVYCENVAGFDVTGDLRLVTPCRLVGGYKRFGRTYRVHLRNKDTCIMSLSDWHNEPF